MVPITHTSIFSPRAVQVDICRSLCGYIWPCDRLLAHSRIWADLTGVISKTRFLRSPWAPSMYSLPFSWMDRDNKVLGASRDTKRKEPWSPNHFMYKTCSSTKNTCIVPLCEQEMTCCMWAIIFFVLFITAASIILTNRPPTRIWASLGQTPCLSCS